MKGEIESLIQKTIPTEIPGEYYTYWEIKIHVSSNNLVNRAMIKKFNLGECEITQE